jgi:hypothetical protein
VIVFFSTDNKFGGSVKKSHCCCCFVFQFFSLGPEREEPLNITEERKSEREHADRQ